MLLVSTRNSRAKPAKGADMKIFTLYRMEDETGISGIGLVAEGVQFSNGKCALTWLTEFSSVAIYDSIEVVDKIHGHNGKTKIIWPSKEGYETAIG